MLRLITAVITILCINTVYAVSPSGVGGELGTLNYVNNIKAPNYQVTSLGGVNSRMETGNTNLLMNPSFEHTTVYTGWTINGGTTSPFSNATVTEDTTNQVEGKKAISIAPSAALLMTQDSTVNAANLTGLQGVASVKIKATGTTGLKVCPRNAGAAVTNLCVNVTADNTWKHISIPFILGVTSNGIGIATTATGGTVIIDDAFVGTSAPFQDVSGAKLVGACTTTLGSDQTSTSATYAALSAATSISVVTYGQGQAPSTNTTGCKFASIPAGDYTIIWDGEFGNQTTAARAFFSISDGTNQSTDEVGAIGSSGFGANTMTARISYSTAQSNITFVPVAKIQTGVAIIKANTKQTFKLYYFPPATKIYSQASQDYDWTQFTATSPNSSFTIASSECFKKRKGSDLLLRCKFTPSSSAASEARIALPDSLLSSSSSIPSIQIIGQAELPFIGSAGQSVGSSFGVYIEPSVGYVTFGARSSAATGLSKLLANSMTSTTPISFYASIPISGWSDYGVIVGSFAGIEKCANDYECTDTFSAQVSATGVVSNENVDWINGNCSNPSASNYTCTFNTNLKDGTSGLSSAMNCVITRDQATAAAGYTDPRVTSTTTGLTISLPSPVSTNINQPFSIKCQKGSQDYKPKTAKVAVPATETFVSYWLSANFAASTTTPINFDSVEFDNCSPSCVTTSATAWKFTAKYSGTYQVILKQNITTATTVVSSIFINGTKIKNVAISANGAYTFGSAIVRMNAGDYLDIRPDASVSYSGGVLSGSFTSVSVSRLGNQ